MISGDKDGADLRREERKAKFFSRCSGKSDDGQINDALQSAHKDILFSIPAEDWKRIFGRQNEEAL